MLQSCPLSTRTGVSGSQAGSGSVTPQATATSSESLTQALSQLGTPSPSRSEMIGPVNGSVQSGFEPAWPIIAHVGAEQTELANTW